MWVSPGQQESGAAIELKLSLVMAVCTWGCGDVTVCVYMCSQALKERKKLMC